MAILESTIHVPTLLLDGSDSGENKPSDLSGGFVFPFPSRAVANMMRRWNYREGSGLGAQGQGIVVPIQAGGGRVRRRPKAGLGYREKPYDNGLDVPPPPPVEELRELEDALRALRLEAECREKILVLLRETRLEAESNAKTAAALAAIVRSRKKGRHGKRVPGTLKARLPSSATRYIIEQVITPRMAVDVREWIPSWDPDCHDWLRPLIPLIGHLPESLYGAVESKLGGGDYEVVSPWKEYLSPAQWDTFSKRHILPKLTRLVRGLRITPPKQTDSSFRAVMLWAPLVHAQDVVSILEAEQFFDKWEGALQHWLQAGATKPSFGEATAWCAGWKKLFTPELLADKRVLAHLEAGLDIVDRAMQDLDGLF
ncbi:septin and tuftelin-interacting protein 1 homolog 1-like [Aegilops tauschii subsp. strangulata]|nr:septin and tuftelin-interacting protein 1 homolog 1-like [Aegilops tauschii subsp. strangulata]XP_044354603.1 septin and tuftelin-interacting protein 1 homolog 1-like [Triticum aestivum]